jgi:hypothetical protein
MHFHLKKSKAVMSDEIGAKPKSTDVKTQKSETTVADPNKKYKCSLCDKKAREDDLWEHIPKAHGHLRRAPEVLLSLSLDPRLSPFGLKELDIKIFIPSLSDW